jgi:hypothetical protein
MDISKIPYQIRHINYQYLGGDFDTDSEEESDKLWSKIEKLSVRELFDNYLQWEGIIGYTDLIISYLKELWEAELDGH